MQQHLKAIPMGQVDLLPSIFQERFLVNRRYVMSLDTDRLLQNYYLEAGLWGPRQLDSTWHGGWESPTCQLRGHFLGHWLSAAAHIYANTGDPEVKGKADRIVAELARCQAENGGEWAGPIPEKYLDWVARGKRVWAPHYTLHKPLMGLYEMTAYTGNEQALEVLNKWAAWFHRWTGQFSQEQLDDILDVETGGMLEVWANLYGLTGRSDHLDLLNRYDRRRLFDPLLAGEDVLTNMHANTTIPEVHGAARAWEVTGADRWRRIVDAYWQSAVTRRGYFCTGGQTSGEIWTPPGEFAARLGDKNQEHCTVYNMIRLAEFLLRWTGDVSYADYIERNLYNGILAQQHPETGMIAYFLPLQAGSVKKWGSPTQHFWCCHGTLVQAHTGYANQIFYEDDDGLVVSQFIPAKLSWDRNGTPVTVTLVSDRQLGAAHRPNSLAFDLTISCDQPQSFALKIRLPWWLAGEALITVNGESQTAATAPASFISLTRTWARDIVHLELPKTLTTCPLPDAPDTVAFMDGPVVLAGLCDPGSPVPEAVTDAQTDHTRTIPPHSGCERTLYGALEAPQTILVPDNEREWAVWLPGYRTRNQAQGMRFIPLYEIRSERYTVYFPVRPPV